MRKTIGIACPSAAARGAAMKAAAALPRRRPAAARIAAVGSGAAASLRSITDIVGPTLFTLTFAYFIRSAAPLHLPGAPFLLAALLLLIALALTWRVTYVPAR